MEALDGRVAVVTGAAGGIGLALGEAFAREGMRLVLADVDAARLDAAAGRLAASTGAEVVAVRTDASSAADVEALARQAVGRFGAVDVLCNNAGVTRPARAWELAAREWDWVLGVNVLGVVHGINAFVPAMIERGEPAHVVNTASVGGLVAFPGLAAYCASKYAVVGLSESLRHDLRQAGAPVGVSVLCPGPTKTDFRANSRALCPDEPEHDGSDEVEVAKMAPVDVAGQVVDAIRRDRFWILTHPAYGSAIEERARGIVETDDVVVPGFL